MTLNELVQKVLSITKRTDKEQDIRTSVRKAIRVVHTAAYFPFDIVEEEVELGGAYSNFKVPLPPHIRKFIAVAPLSNTGDPLRLTTKDNLLEEVEITNLIDSFHERKSDIYYKAGAVLNIRSSVAGSKLYLAFYALPEVSDNNLETWIMRDHESVVIDAALSDFYLQVGREKNASLHKSEMLQQLALLINDYCSVGE